MQISDAGIDLVKSFEGYMRALPDGRCEAYQEPGDVPTIGWGCTKGITLGMVWTREEAEAALRRELAIHEKRVADLVDVPLIQCQFDALVSFDYNTGGLTLEDGSPSTLLRKLNAGDIDGAVAEFARWNKMGGKVLPGLTARRAKEAALFLDDRRPMPQTIDPPKTYTAQDMKASSTKWSIATWLQRLVGGGGTSTALGLVSPDIGTIVNAGSTVAKTSKDAGLKNVLIAIVIMVVSYAIVIALEWLKVRILGDANSGNYTPSGDTKATKAKEA